MEARVANNGYVPFQHVGETPKWPWFVKCHTDKSECCAPSNGRQALGDWFYPNGSVVLSDTQFRERYLNSRDHPFFAKNRGEKIVRLYRPENPTLGELRGRFHCVIPNEEGNNQTIYINICRFMY